MAKLKRVFEIARELDVQSKAVLEKCRAEGLELKNHMSTISVGLEATIREWFSESADSAGSTTVETAEHVDLKKVKAKPRRRKAAKKVDEAEAETEAKVEAKAKTKAPAIEEPIAEPQDEPAVEVDMPVEVEPAVKKVAAKKSKAKAKSKPKPKPKDEAESKTKKKTKTKKKKKAESDEKESKEKKPRVRPNVPKRPDVIVPAGPQVKPKAAKTKGPKVVRVEQPDHVPTPRPRRAAGPGGRPPAQTDSDRMAPDTDLIPQRGPVRGRGAGGGGPEDKDASRSPRRKRTSRRKDGRTSEAEAWFKGARREQDLIEREERLNHAAGFLKQRRLAMKKRAMGQSPVAERVSGVVEIVQPFTIKDLSSATGIKAAGIIKFLFNKGVMATINNMIDTELAMEICMEYEIELEVRKAQTAEDQIVAQFDQRERTNEKRRPPVVAVLGHVDHGKTSLLDKIRSTDVADGEAGGITQHIGAFRATIRGSDGDEKTVVFLDTPGHQAFTNMRARGANMADLVVLVVAADDGVMPQTIESINHAKASGVPLVVALNKIDLPNATDANIQKILGQLAENELNPVEWGGSTEVIKVSAQTGEGITDIMEILDYQAELLDLKADYTGTASGQVIEAELDMGRGPIARVMVQEGQLKIGDVVVVGRAFGKVRSIMDDHGRQLTQAGPATPVELSGIDRVPNAGDKMYVTGSLKQAEQIAEHRLESDRKHELAAKTKVTLDNVFEQMQAGAAKELRVVLKADVQGSVEVLRKSLEELGTDDARVQVIHSAVGGITNSDVLLAEASDAVIIGFQVIASAGTRNEAERRGVDLRLYRVIYDIADDVTAALEGMLDPEKREEVVGHAEVREVFKVSKVGTVAGCYVTDGQVKRNALIRVTRDGIVIEHDRTLEQLKRFKDDAREVRANMECGMKIDGYDDIRVGDVLECYNKVEVRATLS